jgi:outer membrane protein
MKRIFLTIFLMIFIGTAYAELKIGFVQINKILKQAPQTAISNKKLAKEFKAKTDKLKKSIVALETSAQKYKKNSLTMDDATKKAKERELQLTKIDIQREERELKEDINLRRREEINSLQGKINRAIEKFAEKEKFDLILYQGVAYAGDGVDITKDIVKAMGSDK